MNNRNHESNKEKLQSFINLKSFIALSLIILVVYIIYYEISKWMNSFSSLNFKKTSSIQKSIFISNYEQIPPSNRDQIFPLIKPFIKNKCSEREIVK